MGRGKIELKRRDRYQIEHLLNGGLQAVRTTLRALGLAPDDPKTVVHCKGVNIWPEMGPLLMRSVSIVRTIRALFIGFKVLRIV